MPSTCVKSRESSHEHFDLAAEAAAIDTSYNQKHPACQPCLHRADPRGWHAGMLAQLLPTVYSHLNVIRAPIRNAKIRTTAPCRQRHNYIMVLSKLLHERLKVL